MPRQKTTFWERIQETYEGAKAPEIARLTGKTKQTVYRWRDGDMPPLDVLIEISRSRGVSLSWLAMDQGPKSLSSWVGTQEPDTNLLSATAEVSANGTPLAENLAEAFEAVAEQLRQRLTDRRIHSGMVDVPIVASISEGPLPDDLTKNNQSVSLPLTETQQMITPRLWRVSGDSLRDMNLVDGDLLLIGDSEYPNNQTVIAYVQGRGTLAVALKIWRQRGESVLLEPANRELYPEKKIGPIKNDMIDCAGVVYKVIRNLVSPQSEDLTTAVAAQEEDRASKAMRMVRKENKR